VRGSIRALTAATIEWYFSLKIYGLAVVLASLFAEMALGGGRKGGSFGVQLLGGDLGKN